MDGLIGLYEGLGVRVFGIHCRASGFYEGLLGVRGLGCYEGLFDSFERTLWGFTEAFMGFQKGHAMAF